jgi:hypothetical protein
LGASASATKVAASYRALVAKTREVAGGHMRAAWGREPITTDTEMNVPGGIDFSAIDPFVDAYLDAVAEDLAWHRFWR